MRPLIDGEKRIPSGRGRLCRRVRGVAFFDSLSGSVKGVNRVNEAEGKDKFGELLYPTGKF